MTTYTINNELNGIEISFDSKPQASTLEGLKKMGFRWHNKKKMWYAKNTAERLELVQILASAADYAAQVRREEPKAKTEKKAVENVMGVKVGDVFYESWGYEQTNIDFWQVTELKGKTQIILKAIGSETVESVGFCSVMVRPVKNLFAKHYAGEEIRKTVKGTRENPYCSADHGLLYKTSWEKTHNETSYY